MGTENGDIPHFRRAIPSALALLLAVSGRAGAHGGLSMEEDTCKLRIGSYVMHFTGYQPESRSAEEFCEDIPDTGATIIVLDFLDAKLRDLPVEARIIRDTGDDSNLEAITVFRLPPAVYGRGSLHFEHRFPEPGRFVGLVTVLDQPPLVSRFPFAVGTGAGWTWFLYAAAGLGAVAAGAALFLYSSRSG